MKVLIPETKVWWFSFGVSVGVILTMLLALAGVVFARMHP